VTDVALTRALASQPVTLAPKPAAVRVLEVDPDLGATIEEGQRALAAGFAVAPMYEFERGPWLFAPPPDPGGFGALVLDGLMIVRLDAGARSHVELIGEGDLVSPWVGSGMELTVPSVVTASVLSRTRIALLDRRFALHTAPWPEIHAALIRRLIVRSRRLSLQSAINSISRIEERLEVTLWEFAARFGRVTSGGIVLELPLTHSQLADVVAAQRPSVSTAISRLQEHGRLAHPARHRWVLRGEPPATLTSLAQQSGSQP
jgi:CRP/FNR family transcriptional regulator, cyclic AMP receptor protein